LKIDLKQVSLIESDPHNIYHKKSVWKIFNENLEFFLTNKSVTFEDHCKWWKEVFLREYIYLILFKSKICGYIRLTKYKTDNKDKHEISMAITKKYQNLGIGTYAYNLFEKEIKKFKINKIIAIVKVKNIIGQNFWKKNGFIEHPVKYIKQL